MEFAMPGAGTDKTKRWVEQPGPCVILVEPQLADNIGAAARAMANFGLGELRLVNPRPDWRSERARSAGSAPDASLNGAHVYPTLPDAIADLAGVFATTARPRGVAKQVLGA